MNLAAFGQTLSDLMKEAQVKRQDLADHFNVSVSLVDRWKSTVTDEKQHRRPQPEQFIALTHYFAAYLDLDKTSQWAEQAGYPLSEAEARQYLQISRFPDPPEPKLPETIRRLEPLPAHRLFGIESPKTALMRALNDTQDHWLLVIDGIGGIGKTSLANWLVREQLRGSRFYDIAWISAKQETYIYTAGIQSTGRPEINPASLTDALLAQLAVGVQIPPALADKEAMLQHWFSQQPYLVVIDNLESIHSFEPIINLLRMWLKPTKFLVTSRYSLPQTDVFRHRLTELSADDAFALLRYLGEKTLPALAEATSSDLARIYNVVGGNPLALKLVAGQIHFTGLSEVLEWLQQAHSEHARELYRFIYRQIWQSLPESSRQVLIAMPLAKGGRRQDIKRSSKVDEAALSQALEQLNTRSLVEIIHSTLDEPRYDIHRLTESFLQTEIFNKWKPH